MASTRSSAPSTPANSDPASHASTYHSIDPYLCAACMAWRAARRGLAKRAWGMRWKEEGKASSPGAPWSAK
eukprot:2168431-Rhodomonas_salina.1